MRILFDQGTPAPLRHALADHAVSTAYETGCASLTNGDLLDEAERGFDALVTTDQNLPDHQHLTGCRLAVVILPPSMPPCWRGPPLHEGQQAALAVFAPPRWARVNIPSVLGRGPRASELAPNWRL